MKGICSVEIHPSSMWNLDSYICHAKTPADNFICYQPVMQISGLPVVCNRTHEYPMQICTA